jgi:hypothetical protein
MKKSLLEIYALAVCFVAAITALVGLISFANAGLVLAAPGVMMTVPPNLENNDAFWMSERTFDPATKAYVPRPAEDKLTAMRQTRLDQQAASERRTALRTLIRMIVLSLIAGAFFFFHWRIARQERERA